MWLWGSLMMLTWVAIIATAVWLVGRGAAAGTGTTNPPGASQPPSRARAILDERFASGELTAEEYRDHRATLFG